MKLLTALQYLYKAFIKKDEYSRYVLSEKVVNIIYPNHIFSEYGRSFLNDNEFAAFYKKHVGDNVHSYDRKYFLSQLIKLTNNLEGDIAECGVFKGASAYLMFERTTNRQKKMHLFDSFEGLSTPEAIDGNYWVKGDLSINEKLVRRIFPSQIEYYIIKAGSRKSSRWLPTAGLVLSTWMLIFINRHMIHWHFFIQEW